MYAFALPAESDHNPCIIPLASRQWFLSHEPLEDDPEISARYQADIADLHTEIEAAEAFDARIEDDEFTP